MAPVGPDEAVRRHLDGQLTTLKCAQVRRAIDRRADQVGVGRVDRLQDFLRQTRQIHLRTISHGEVLPARHHLRVDHHFREIVSGRRTRGGVAVDHHLHIAARNGFKVEAAVGTGRPRLLFASEQKNFDPFNRQHELVIGCSQLTVRPGLQIVCRSRDQVRAWIDHNAGEAGAGQDLATDRGEFELAHAARHAVASGIDQASTVGRVDTRSVHRDANPASPRHRLPQEQPGEAALVGRDNGGLESLARRSREEIPAGERRGIYRLGESDPGAEGDSDLIGSVNREDIRDAEQTGCWHLAQAIKSRVLLPRNTDDEQIAANRAWFRHRLPVGGGAQRVASFQHEIRRGTRPGHFNPVGGCHHRDGERGPGKRLRLGPALPGETDCYRDKDDQESSYVRVNFNRYQCARTR